MEGSMVRGSTRSAVAALSALAALLVAAPAAAQFNSGSSGIHGSFPPFPTGTTTLPAGTHYALWNMSSGLVRYCQTYDTTRRPDTCTVELGTGQIPNIPSGGLTTGRFEFTNV